MVASLTAVVPIHAGVHAGESKQADPQHDNTAWKLEDIADLLLDPTKASPALQKAVIADLKKTEKKMDRVVLQLAAVTIVSLILAVILIEMSWYNDNLHPSNSSYIFGANHEKNDLENSPTPGQEAPWGPGATLTLQSLLMVCSFVFCGLLIRESYLQAKNRMPLYHLVWSRDLLSPTLLAELAINLTTSYPTMHPIFALFAFFRVLHLFKLLRWAPQNKLHREFQMRACLSPPQDGLTAVKSQIRATPWLFCVEMAVALIPSLSYSVLALERWAMAAQGMTPPKDFGEAIWWLLRTAVIGEGYHPSGWQTFGNVLGALVLLSSVVIGSLLLTALMQTIESDAGLEAAMAATAKKQLKEAVRTGAIDFIKAWIRLRQFNRRRLTGGGDDPDSGGTKGKKMGRNVRKQSTVAGVSKNRDDPSFPFEVAYKDSRRRYLALTVQWNEVVEEENKNKAPDLSQLLQKIIDMVQEQGERQKEFQKQTRASFGAIREQLEELHQDNKAHTSTKTGDAISDHTRQFAHLESQINSLIDGLHKSMHINFERVTETTRGAHQDMKASFVQGFTEVSSGVREEVEGLHSRVGEGAHPRAESR